MERQHLSCKLWNVVIRVIIITSVISSHNHYALSFTSRSSFSTPPSAKERTCAPQKECAHLFPYLSILIPAYNEEQRIGKTLQEYRDYLVSHPYWKRRLPARCQIVVVDDGSSDGTAALVEQMAQHSPIKLSCISLPNNSGKGAALAYGMDWILHNNSWQSSSGKYHHQGWILTADADASAPLSALDSMITCVQDWYHDTNVTTTDSTTIDGEFDNTSGKKKVLQQGSPLQVLVAGYRTYDSAAPSRLLFRWGFRTVVRTVMGDDLQVRDSQCGFKLISASAAAHLYQNLYVNGWAHDVEVLYRARMSATVTVLEQAVPWQDKPGSKLVASPGGILAVSAQMLYQVLRLRWGYASGAWSLPQAPDDTK